VASLPYGYGRPDVVDELVDPDAEGSGFWGGWTTARSGKVTVYAVLADGLAHPVGDPMTSPPGRLRRPDGSKVPVTQDPATGSVDSVVEEKVQLTVATLPPSVEPAAYQLMTIGSDTGDLGRTTVEIANSRSTVLGRDRAIRAEALPVAGSDLSVRVGSCLQWRGFNNRKIYLTQTGGRLIDRVMLSAVA